MSTDFDRKISILLRMALPLLGIGLTVYQVPTVVSHAGAQQNRSLVASFDILLATFTSNAVVLGSLLQDRGYKKEKYKPSRIKQDFHHKRGHGTLSLMRWSSDDELMRLSSGKEDERGISLDTLSLKSKKGGKKEAVMERARFPEIRVNSTWEVQVEVERYVLDKETTF